MSEEPDPEPDDDWFEVVESGQGTSRRGVYLLPNLFTTGALFAGFYAIIAAMNGLFEQSALGIIVAGILDGMDGGVARLTNTQSEFGGQYDSLSDCVAFGVAPGVVAYAWGLTTLGQAGWAAAFLYVACAALRLARFNVQADPADKRFFVGLPSPSAAGTVAVMVWLGATRGFTGDDLPWVVALVTAGLGLLMVSSVPFHSFKEFNIGRVPFRVLLGVIVLLAVVFVDPPVVLLGVALIYIASGLSMAVLRWWRRGGGLPWRNSR
jgi:CDP-diacylglycerol--serine O-phosphatidyltransferase